MLFAILCHTLLQGFFAPNLLFTPTNLCSPLMIWTQKEFGSFFSLHNHLVSNANFRDRIEPIPIPPTALGAIIFSQATHLILFLQEGPPQMNCLRTFSIDLITPFEAPKMDRKNVGRLPNTDLARVILPPKLRVFAFQVESLDFNLSTIVFHEACRFI